MEENQSFASEVLWEVMGESAPSLILNGVDLILSIVTMVFMVVGTIWLARSAQPGALACATLGNEVPLHAR